ncbi:MAG: hypothetical protein ACTSRW_01220, partial [Candidatus Helarchaeota archaeon]
MVDVKDKKFIIIPLLGFFGFWIANVIAGLIVFAFGIYNPFAYPFGPWYDGQVAGPYPLNIFELLFLIVLIQIPVYA